MAIDRPTIEPKVAQGERMNVGLRGTKKKERQTDTDKDIERKMIEGKITQVRIKKKDMKLMKEKEGIKHKLI